MKRKVKLFNILSIIMILKGFFTSFLYFYYDGLLFSEESILYILVTVCSFYLVVSMFLRLLEMKEEIKDRFLVSKNLDDTKRLKTYMFKITHEIKNPIAVCKGYLDMLNPNDIDKTVRYVNIIRSEMNRALTVLTDALDYDKIVVEKDIMDVVLLLEDVMESYKELLKGKNIKLKYICKYEELFILGDYNRLKQVIVNLLKNAIEAKKAKEQLLITLKVKLDNNKINIIIKDNGTGMEEEVLNNIGVDFFTTKKTGSGLGVSISKDIIKKHDGELVYKSHKDDGTSAIVMLPNNCKL